MGPLGYFSTAAGLLALICVILLVLRDPATPEFKRNGIRVRFSQTFRPEQPEDDAFYVIPLTREEAKSSGEWVIHDSPIDNGDYLGNPATLPNDNRFAVLYDDNGYVCGLQIGIAVSEVDIEENPYEYDRVPIYRKVNRYGEEVYLSTVYTVDPSIITRGGRSAADFEAQGAGTGLYIQNGTTSSIVKVDYSSSGDPLWIPEKCITMMGWHYYYNMSKELDCKTLHPIFILHQNEILTGFGLQTFGRVTARGRRWYEDIPIEAIEATLYEYPDCMPKFYKEVGLISVHVYFQDDPWTIKCPS